MDRGTTSSRAIVFDQTGAIRAVAQREFAQVFPQPGWVEHVPNEIISSQVAVAAEAIVTARLVASDIAALGITNQRETTVVWDRKTGQPIYNAIVWQDRRTAAFCDKLKADGLGPLFARKTGLLQVADVLSAMQEDSGIPLTELRVDGGASVNNLLLQFQADLLGVPVLRPALTESTALGAAYLAGLAVGYWRDQSEISRQWKVGRVFEPSMSRERRGSLKVGWNKALARAQGWDDKQR